MHRRVVLVVVKVAGAVVAARFYAYDARGRRKHTPGSIVPAYIETRQADADDGRGRRAVAEVLYSFEIDYAVLSFREGKLRASRLAF